MERPQLITSALKKGLQMVNDLFDHFCAPDHFTDWCLKFKYEKWAVMTLYKVVYKDMQKKAGQSKITSFFTKSSVSLCTALCIFQIPKQLLAQNTNMIPININTNTVVFMNH